MWKVTLFLYPQLGSCVFRIALGQKPSCVSFGKIGSRDKNKMKMGMQKASRGPYLPKRCPLGPVGISLHSFLVLPVLTTLLAPDQNQTQSQAKHLGIYYHLHREKVKNR